MNLIGAKVYYDGSHWIAIPHTERPFKRKRRKRTKDKDETVEQFEKAFNKTAKGKKAKKKEKLLKEFAPLFDSEAEATEFVEKQFERLNRNRIERYKRLKRKAYLQQWSFFCTFTYDSTKQSEESFRKQLMTCLYHLANRNGWRYIGAWERGDKTERSTPLCMCRLTLWLASWKNTTTMILKRIQEKLQTKILSLTSVSGVAISTPFRTSPKLKIAFTICSNT